MREALRDILPTLFACLVLLDGLFSRRRHAASHVALVLVRESGVCASASRLLPFCLACLLESTYPNRAGSPEVHRATWPKTACPTAITSHLGR
jgi:hypothetical protein